VHVRIHLLRAAGQHDVRHAALFGAGADGPGDDRPLAVDAAEGAAYLGASARERGIVAVCRSGAADVGAEMVRSGFATAYRRYSNDYVDEENEARTARRGIWAGEFTNPEDYRHDDEQNGPAQRRSGSAAESKRCDGCYIKGNVNAQGERIYHVPGSSSYDETAIDESKGERWFRTESEARAAGWRAPRG